MILAAGSRIPGGPNQNIEIVGDGLDSHRGHFRYRSTCRQRSDPAENIAIEQRGTSSINKAVEKESTGTISREKEYAIGPTRSRKDRFPGT